MRPDHRPPKRIVIKDVAARAGVAVATVSRVLSGSTDVRADLRERVLRAAAELDFQPDILAQSLRRGATRSVGFIADDLSNHLIADIATGAESVLRSQGYSLLVMNSERDPELDPANIRVLRARRVDALMMCPAEEGHQETVDALQALDIPLCIVEGDQPVAVRASYVLSDHRTAMSEALQRLVELGHERIAVITGPGRYRSARERAKAVADLAGEGRRDLHLVHVETELNPTDAWSVTISLLRGESRPTAIVTGGDGSLPGIIEGIGACGLELGSDVSLVTTDPGELGAVFRPPLTAILRDGLSLGAKAAELLLERIADPELPPVKVMFPARFEPRASITAPPVAVRP